MVSFDNGKGLILKGIGGFYYVKTAGAVLECRAKGIFRKRGVKPLAGDEVLVEEAEGGNVISEILERKNFFNRPPVANVDNFVLVVSATEPEPNLLVIDRLLVLCEQRGMTPVIVVTKTDLKEADHIFRVYRGVGYEVLDTADPAAPDRMRELGKDRVTVFCGNSGVGKSTFINKLCPGLDLATNGISYKLGRGKHTTRAVELYEYAGGWIADTPGFSALDFERTENVPKEELADCFPEFREHVDGCYFTGCSHTVEKGCTVLEALREGKIDPGRHENYCYLYNEAKQKKQY